MSTTARVDILLALKSTLEGAEQSLGFLTKLTGGLSAAAIAWKAVDLAKQSGQLASEIKNLSAEANVSTAAFQALKNGSAEFGVKQEELVRGAVTLRKNLEEAAKNGASPLNDRLAALSLTAAGLQALAPERQFEVLGQRIAAATDKNAAFAAALDLLGAKQAPKLIEFLQTLGVQGFERMAASTRDLALTAAELETLDKAANYWERIATAAKVATARRFAAVGDAIYAEVPSIVQAQQKMDAIEKEPREKFQFQLGLQILRLNKARADFVREAIKAADSMNLAAAEDTLAKMVKSGAALEVVADFRRQIRAGQTGNKQVADNSAAQNRAMSAASLEADLRGMDTSARITGQRVSAFDVKTLNSGIEATQKAIAAENTALEQSAEKFKNLADPQRVFTEQLKEIDRLQTKGKLTAEEAAAATARLKAEMGHDLANAIDASNDALRGFGERAAALDNNPFLTDVEKHRARVALLREENAQIDAQITLLKEFADANPGVDPAAVRGQIRGLSDRGSRNSGQIGAPDLAAAGIGANLSANLTGLLNKLRTPAQGVADTITGTIGTALDSVDQNLKGLIRGTEDWGSALANIGSSILDSVIEGIVKMFTTWVAQRAIAGLASIMWSETEGTADTAAKAPGAALSSISSFGAAAVIGVAALVAAMAAFGGFEKGGYTGDIDTSAIAGLVHGQEYVMDAGATARLGRPFLDSLRFSDPSAALSALALRSSTSAGATAASTGLAQGGKESRVLLVDHRETARIDTILADPRFHTRVQHIGRQDRGV